MKNRMLLVAILLHSLSLSAQFKQVCNISGSNILDPSNQAQKSLSCETLINSPFSLSVFEKIGQGAFGKVFSGKAILTENNVVKEIPIAIKQIRLKVPVPEGYESVSDSDQPISTPQEVKNEFDNLDILFKNPVLSRFIIKPYALFNDGDFSYIVMEQGGMTLDSYFEDNKENFETVFKNITMQLQDALNALKNSGIAHLDLHPKNILVNKKNNIKLIDFALSKKIGQPIEIAGKSLYRDPYILLYKKAYAGYDEYAIAIILDEILEGHSYMLDLLPTKELQNIPIIPGDDKYRELLKNYQQRLKRCELNNKCLLTKYYLLLSLNPNITERKPLKDYINMLR